jgi:hypothetical protein
MVELAALHVADPPELWRDLGFLTDEQGDVHVSGVRHVLGADGRGVRSWSIRGLAGGPEHLDGLPFGLPAAEAQPTPSHPNGVVGLDHLVLATPNLGRTIAAIEAAGVDLRRVRDTGSRERPTQQAFFRLGEVVLEVVGPRSPSGDGAARIYGLAWNVRDLEETAAFLGDRLRPAKDAVQKGRRIATLDRAAGSTVPHAFMSTDR